MFLFGLHSQCLYYFRSFYQHAISVTVYCIFRVYFLGSQAEQCLQCYSSGVIGCLSLWLPKCIANRNQLVRCIYDVAEPTESGALYKYVI